MTVDYVPQMLEIQRGLLAKTEATKPMWQDEVAQRFYSDYIDKYDEYIHNYIHGKNFGNRGMGLEDLLQFFEQQMQEMAMLTGCPMDVAYDSDSEGEVHDNENLKP